MKGLFDNWEEIKEHIRDEYGLTGIAYNIWIKNMKLDGVGNDLVVHPRIPGVDITGHCDGDRFVLRTGCHGQDQGETER